jgi:protein TonB
MAAVPSVPPPVATRLRPVVPAVLPFRPRFDDLVISRPRVKSRRGATAAASAILHVVLIGGLVLVGLLSTDVLPDPDHAVRAFFAAPPEVAPPPPPPPPPVGARRATRPAAPRPVEPATFVAPVEVPETVRPDEGIELGVVGGVEGGVEGGVPGGVVGGIVGGLPEAPPPEPPRRVVRVGGDLRAPALLSMVTPVYPPLAAVARVHGKVLIEAHVGVDGRVKSARVVRGVVLLDEAALEAVKRWRYRPLLLNGEPTEFVLNVTVVFSVTSGGS